jgi:hypothetical protein
MMPDSASDGHASIRFCCQLCYVIIRRNSKGQGRNEETGIRHEATGLKKLRAGTQSGRK